MVGRFNERRAGDKYRGYFSREKKYDAPGVRG